MVGVYFDRRFQQQTGPQIGGGVTTVHVPSEEAAIFATDCSGRSLELRSVVLLDCTIASYEILDGGNKRIAAVGIEK
jgi:hypothetical protein